MKEKGKNLELIDKPLCFMGITTMENVMGQDCYTRICKLSIMEFGIMDIA